VACRDHGPERSTKASIPLMSTISPASPEPAPYTANEVDKGCTLGRDVVAHRPLIYSACTVLAVVINYFLGKETSWDMLNYHVYAGFSAVNDRFAQDYFAAGPQSYFNPYAYVPFYGLVRSGLSSVAIGSLLAMAHSVILWLTYELAILVCPVNDNRMRAIVGACAVALALVNPILLQQLGSSFADITTAELVLGGWLLLAGAVKSPHAGRMVCAGFLLGAASALKLTNSVHALASVAVLAWIPLPLSLRIRHAVFFLIFLSLGFLTVAVPWSYRLEEMFGNPLFPLFNNIFRSPEFTTEVLRQFRFIPHDFWEALWRPFAMINPIRMVHEELSAPDPRYAVLVVLGSGLLGRWLWRRRTQSSRKSIQLQEFVRAPVLAALGCGLAADWALWLSASGNSRYFLPMSCVAAALLAGWLFRFFSTKTRIYVLAVIFLSQTTQLLMGAELRWTGATWGGPWLNITMPQKLAVDSSLYLTIGMQSNSFLAPFLASGSGLVNFSGSYTPLANEGATGARVNALIDRYEPHVRVLLRGAKLYEDNERRAPRRSRVDDSLSRFGLRVDTTDCATITVHGLPPEMEVGFGSTEAGTRELHLDTYLVSCSVVRDHTDHSPTITRKRAVDLVLDRLEDACPELLQPRRSGTERDGNNWRRLYMNTDLRVSVGGGRVWIRDPLRADAPVFAGREDDWAAQKTPRLACGRDSDGYFAKQPKSN
jgi:hypothetical protein